MDEILVWLSEPDILCQNHNFAKIADMKCVSQFFCGFKNTDK